MTAAHGEGATSRAAASDPHVAWERRMREIMERCDSDGSLGDDRAEVLMRQVYLFEDKIASTPARTLAGALAQLRVTRLYQELAREGVAVGDVD